MIVGLWCIWCEVFCFISDYDFMFVDFLLLWVCIVIEVWVDCMCELGVIEGVE